MRVERLKSEGGRARQILREDGVQVFAQKALDTGIAAYWENLVNFTPRRLTTPLEDVPIDRPIFLLGTQAGGLTLVARILRRHPEVVGVTGNYRFWTGFDEAQNRFYHSLPEELRLSPMHGGAQDHPTFGTQRNWVYATEEMLPAYRQTDADWTPELDKALKDIVRRCVRAYAPDINTARFIDKSQSYTLKIPLLRRCLGEPKLVMVTRNPYALCWRQARHSSIEWRTSPSRDEVLVKAAEHWFNSLSIGLRDMGQDGIFVRFEDLLNDPHTKIHEVLDYVGLEYFPGLIPDEEEKLPRGTRLRTKWFPLKPSVNDRYLAEIPSEAVAILKPIIGDLARDCGYFPPR